MSRKTTVYLPEPLKDAVERAAQRRGCSEAEIIRQAIAASTASLSRNGPKNCSEGSAIDDRR